MIDKLLNILKDISEIIAENNDCNQALTEIVNLLAKDLDVNVCSIYVHNKQNNTLVLSASFGLKDISNISMNVGEGLTGTSFETRKILNINEPKKHPKFKFFKNSGEKLFKSYLAVPLSVGGVCVGIIVIQRENAEKFDNYTTDMVKSLSTQLGNLILNTQIIKELSEKSTKPKNIVKEGLSLNVRGIPANNGIAKGKAYIFESRNYFKEIYHQTHSDVKKELDIFDKAIKLSIQKTLDLENKALSLISEADASIFNVHLLFLEDKSLINTIKKEISENDHSIEFSIKIAYNEYKKRFKKLKDSSFRDKIMDIKDTLLRLVESTKEIRFGSNNPLLHLTNIVSPRILIAAELLPSDLIRMPIDNIAGIICEKGGITAHVAILAKALDIPALLGVKNITQNVKKYDEVLLDCFTGLAYIRPDKTIKDEFKEMTIGRPLAGNIDLTPAITTDGIRINLRGNVSLVCEIDKLKEYGAEGIGLYRTEFLYMIRDHLPSEQEQINVYSKILQSSGGEPVTLRVLDCGSDKPIPYFSSIKEDNPALGNRGTRLLLSNEDMFITHLRAILRAGVYGNLKLNFPMISSLQELQYIKLILKKVEEQLHEENIEHSENYEIGIMVEVPSVALSLDKFLPHIDFISIGTNDLLQYLYAADRGNDSVSQLSEFFEPFFLKILFDMGHTMKKYPNKSISICGEIASNANAIPFLIGAGIYDLSITLKLIPNIKKTIKLFSVEECENIIKKAIQMQSASEVKQFIEQIVQDKNNKKIQ